MKKILLLTLASILLLSMMANGLSENVSVKSKILGLDDANNQVVQITIVTNKTGHLIYQEDYYTNSKAGLIYLEGRKFVDKNVTVNASKETNNLIIFNILRPKYEGEGKRFTKAIVTLDGQGVLNAWFKSPNKTNNINKDDIKNDTKIRNLRFVIVGIVVLIIAIIVFMLIRKKGR